MIIKYFDEAGCCFEFQPDYKEVREKISKYISNRYKINIETAKKITNEFDLDNDEEYWYDYLKEEFENQALKEWKDEENEKFNH